MKKKFLVLGNAAAKIGAFAFALGLAACGDDSSSNSGTNGVKGGVITLADGSGEKVCDEMLDGWVAEAVGKDFRRCQNGEWTKITASEASAEDEIIGGVTVLQSSSSIIEESSSSSAKDLGSVEDSSSSNVIASEAKQSSSSVIVSSSSTPTEDSGSSSSVKAPEQVDNSSSSSVIPSEVEGSSSSSKAAWAYLNPAKTYGTMTDTRDGQVYKTIEICDKENKNCQTWMAQNLNYAYTGVACYTSDSTSWCYDDDPSNCATYGRLYTWAAAVDSVAIYKNYGEECGYGKFCTRFRASALATAPVRGVCPSGWHLPSNAEWGALYTNVGGAGYAGQKLKANTSLWSSNTGTDEFGISVLPAGGRISYGDFNGRGGYAVFWSSAEYEDDSYYAWIQFFDYDSDYVGQSYYYDKSNGFSVRCLKD